MSTGDKILIVGPAKAGKTAIANFLAKYPDAERAASPASTYTPTVGTRYDGRLADGRLEGDTAASLPRRLAASLPLSRCLCLAVSLSLSGCLAVSFCPSCLLLCLYLCVPRIRCSAAHGGGGGWCCRCRRC